MPRYQRLVKPVRRNNSTIFPVAWNKIWANGDGTYDFAVTRRLQVWPSEPGLAGMVAEVDHHFPTLYEWRERPLTAADVGQFMGGN